MCFLSRLNSTVSKFVQNLPISTNSEYNSFSQKTYQVFWYIFNDNIQNEYLFLFSQHNGHVTNCISNRYKRIIFWHNQWNQIVAETSINPMFIVIIIQADGFYTIFFIIASPPYLNYIFPYLFLFFALEFLGLVSVTWL